MKEGQSRILPRNEAQDDLVVVVGLGKKDQSIESQREGHDLAREAIRTSISSAVRSLKGMITALNKYETTPNYIQLSQNLTSLLNFPLGILE